MKSTPQDRQQYSEKSSSEVLYSRSLARAQSSTSVAPQERQCGDLTAGVVPGMLRRNKSHECPEVGRLAACEGGCKLGVHEILFEVLQAGIGDLGIPVVKKVAIEPGAAERVGDYSVAEQAVDDTMRNIMIV